MGGIGAAAVVVVALSSWCAVRAFQDDDDGTPAGGDADPTPTAVATSTTAASPTTAGQAPSATPARTPSPAASASPAGSPAAATPTTAAPTPTRAATTAPTATRAAATSAPTSAPTATPTNAPTNTPAPTATPTATPTTAPTATPTTAPITNFAGNWHSEGTCDNFTAPYRWSVALTQQGAQVSGYINFHACPGGGQVQYAVSGTATSAQTIQLTGPKSGGVGGLYASTPDQVTFTIAPFGPPSPNYAP